ncbi:MAG: SPOR domain-containing protein [Crocinitomicaceae bacterium]|nr:SPOR domain-containing protein [Crocinitomicaceae bacterium]
MKELFRLICSVILINMSFDSLAQAKMLNYTLDANVAITDCKIVALKESDEIGKVESISGSKINLRIHKDNAYRITVNSDKVFYIEYGAKSGFVQVDAVRFTRRDVLASLAINPDEAAKSEPGLKYRIQVGAFSQDVALNSFMKLGELYTEEIDGGITRYMIGSYMSNEEAEIAEAKIKEMGFEGAFTVVCYNGKRVSFKEAQLLSKTPSALTYN